MPALAWIDDNRGLRDSYVAKSKTLVPKPWKVLGAAPLPSVNDYTDWMQKNDVAVLLLDERLGDETSVGETHVTYKGHEVVDKIRNKWPEFPVFMVTSWNGDLDAKKGKLDDVINKKEIRGGNLASYIERIVRSGMRWIEAHQKQINELSELAAKVATGTAKRREIKKLHALQEMLALAAVPEKAETRGVLLDELDDKVEKLEKLSERLSAFLDKKTKRKK